MISPRAVKAVYADETTVIEAVRNFMKECPYLEEYGQLNVNYLDGAIDSFAIETIPSDPIVKRYVDGSSIRQIQFYFESRETYDKDVINNIQSSGFYEHLADWMEECTKQKVLPALEGNRNSLSIQADTQGYLMDAQNGKASYVIQCTLKYFQSR